MAVKSRLARLAKRAPRRKAAGWVIGVQGDDLPETGYVDYRQCIGDLAPLPDDLVVVDGQVMTQAQWAALAGNKILVIYEQESGVGDDAKDDGYSIVGDARGARDKSARG